jgi:chromosome segregation ATPase
MGNQTSKPPTRTDDSDVALQALTPFVCVQLSSTQLALAGARVEIARLKEEVAAKDAANTDLTAQFALQAALVEELAAQVEGLTARVALQAAQHAELKARVDENEAKHDARFAKHDASLAEIEAVYREALARKDARIADLVAQVQLLTAQQQIVPDSVFIFRAGTRAGTENHSNET